MAKITQTANGATGLTARTNFNEAIKTVETSNGVEGTGEVGTPVTPTFGTIANTVAQGNDSRLSDARTPTAHDHVKLNITDFSDGDYATAAQGATADTALQSFTESDPVYLAEKGAVNGVVANNNSEIGANSVLNHVYITQADYDLLTPVATTIYSING